MGQDRAVRPKWTIYVNDGKSVVMVPVIVPALALTMIPLAVVAIAYLGMKHRERLAKIRSGAANK
jgi:hypothetical protein